MRCIHTPRHRLHDPPDEVRHGVPVPPVERPGRVEAVIDALGADERFELEEPGEHGLEPILAVHDEGLVRFLETAWPLWAAERPEEAAVADTFPNPAMRDGMGPGHEPASASGLLGWWSFDTATPLVEGTYAAARAAVDAAVAATDAVLGGEGVAYALCRPPGHHAARAMFGGYCFFNNAAIGAERIAGETGERVAVLDLDYHHGNGTQQIFYERPDVLYVSLHGDPARAFPHYTGYPDERGAGPGFGSNLNLPLPEGCDDERYLRVLDRALEEIGGASGSILVVSLGMDAHRDDPLGDAAVTTECYGEIGRRVAGLGRRLVVVQEGGYDLASLGESVVRFLGGAVVAG